MQLTWGIQPSAAAPRRRAGEGACAGGSGEWVVWLLGLGGVVSVGLAWARGSGEGRLGACDRGSGGVVLRVARLLDGGSSKIG